MSPDGAWTLYTERRLDWEKNARVRTHFLVPSRGGAARKLPELDKARGARFAPDGARIAFVARVQDDDQVLTVGLQGGPAAQVTRHRGGVDAFAWSPDGSRLYFAAERPRDPAEQDAREAGDDAVFVGEDGNGLEAGRWTDLWVLDVATGAERRLTHLAATIRDLDVAPDGERVAFIAHTDNRENESCS
jgi:dipeptidyl aminopeptidase/acylaminoacyl peptidase